MRQDRWRVYIKPFDIDGSYLSYIDVTDDVAFESVGNITQNLDSADFDVGIFRNSAILIKLRNDHGRYSDIDVEQSIFRYKRSGSLLKITYAIEMEAPLCGVALLGDSYLDDGEEHEIFIGLLNDESLAMDIDQQVVNFQALGRDSILDRMKVPIGSLANGDLISAVIYDCLNDTDLTALLTLSVANITVSTDVAVSDVSKFENKTVKAVLDELLLAGNSVLYVKDGTIYVKPRTATAAVQAAFYGQASNLGAENVSTIKAIKNGLSRTFNLWAWKDTALYAEETTSSGKYGIRRKELSYDWMTNNTHRQTILTNLKGEFGLPKIEFDLFTPLSIDSLDLDLLDRVTIDYPTVYIEGEVEFPICGIAICGDAVLPKALWSFTIDSSTPFKIIGKDIDIKKSEIKFKLREI